MIAPYTFIWNKYLPKTSNKLIPKIEKTNNIDKDKKRKDNGLYA